MQVQCPRCKENQITLPEPAYIGHIAACVCGHMKAYVLEGWMDLVLRDVGGVVNTFLETLSNRRTEITDQIHALLKKEIENLPNGPEQEFLISVLVDLEITK